VPALAAVAAGVEVKGAGVVGAGVERADGGVAPVKDGAGLFGEAAQVCVGEDGVDHDLDAD
jgi:hypothetical protein